MVRKSKLDRVGLATPGVDETSGALKGAVLLKVDLIKFASSEVEGTSLKAGSVVEAELDIILWLLGGAAELQTDWDSLEESSAFEEETEIILLKEGDEPRLKVFEASSKDMLTKE